MIRLLIILTLLSLLITSSHASEKINSEAVLSPDGSQIIFIKQIKELKDNPAGIPEDDGAIVYQHWSPDEIWVMDSQSKEEKVLVKSHYGANAKENRGWFSDLNYSPDGKKIYYVCQPGSPTTHAIRSVNSDGTEDKWITWGESVDVIGGNESDEYFGSLIIERKAEDGAYDVYSLMTPEGAEIMIVEDIKRWLQENDIEIAGYKQ